TLDARGHRRLGRRLPPLLRRHRPLLPGLAGRLGALVRARRARDACVRGRHRRALPLAPHALARARDGAVRPEASRATARPLSSKEDQYARQAEGWTEQAYADVGAYLAHRAELIESLGTRLGSGDTVLDLACGDGGLGEALLARGLGYRGIDATPQ